MLRNTHQVLPKGTKRKPRLLRVTRSERVRITLMHQLRFRRMGSTWDRKKEHTFRDRLSKPFKVENESVSHPCISCVSEEWAAHGTERRSILFAPASRNHSKLRERSEPEMTGHTFRVRLSNPLQS